MVPQDDRPPMRWCAYVEKWWIATGDERLKIELLGIIVLGVWMYLSNFEIFTLKALAILAMKYREQKDEGEFSGLTTYMSPFC